MTLHRTDYELRQYCGACPEGYEVWLDGAEIGHTRLRHGSFRAEYTYAGADETVYRANPDGDGVFEEYERDYYLNAAVAAIDARHHRPESDEVEESPTSQRPCGWRMGPDA